jgi:hypothetical protein
MRMKTKTNRLGLIESNYSRKLVSFVEIGREFLGDSPTVLTVSKAYDSTKTGVRVLGFGLFGLFAIRQFTK